MDTADDKREKRVEARFSQSEYEIICHKAFKARLQTAVYLRECGLNKELKEALPVDQMQKIQAFYRIMAGIGNNLNQIVKKMHQEGFAKNAKEIIELINKLDEII
jgi:methionyl-tRNA synthetase